MFLAAYSGPSMNPTLREPETMEIVPYGGKPLRVGDVAFFLPPDSQQPVVHRIVRVTPAGISTLGDNNDHEDSFLLQPGNIQGEVVAAWRGQQRRKIAGGFRGRCTSRWFRLHGALDRAVSPLLHPVYRTLSRMGLFARLFPARWQPRVVVFHAHGHDQLQLLLGQRTIGQYDTRRHQWQIQRPFQLLVDERSLPKQQDSERAGKRESTDRQRTMNKSDAQDLVYNLVLADGRHWEIAAGDAEAASIVAQLGNAMQLQQTPNATEAPHTRNVRRLLVQVDAHTSLADSYVPLASADNRVTCVLSPSEHWGGPHVNLVRLSLVIARETQTCGGFLIHGALAERDGVGVILAAPGGTGKTTASNRFPAPWHSLCDDATLITRDRLGNYWAHPWPTWSRYLNGGQGGSWNVQKALPLKGIFILAHAATDRSERIGPGQAVSLLVECVRQASMFMPLGLSREEVRTLYLERFNNLCALAKIIPTHILHISLTGTFWQNIEQALELNHE